VHHDAQGLYAIPVVSCRFAAARTGAELSSTSCRYAAPLYVDIKKIVRTRLPEDEGGDWTEDVEEYPKVFVGEVGDPALQSIQKRGQAAACVSRAMRRPIQTPCMACLQVPIMLRSNYCSLADRSEKELADLGECPYDQVRW
jgi:RNA polymerase beta subunit